MTPSDAPLSTSPDHELAEVVRRLAEAISDGEGAVLLTSAGGVLAAWAEEEGLGDLTFTLDGLELGEGRERWRVRVERLE